ncbi:nucleolar protein 6-like [Acanthaster planci]|uniref:Nucleolar protein 6 n=1 Tax=Acanthaster planci TaxID=133434 RepID=A0A8B7ZGI8_ACAPL|nr:nucleolar protein 6-like [Acanthaster planci]
MASPPTKPSSPPLKRAKLSKGALYKPPTNEELNTLRETENLYRSNLFRMQMEELIGEVRVKETKKQLITKSLQELNDILTSLPSQEVDEITDPSWLPNDIKCPTSWDRSQVRGQMSFHKPASVKVVGSFLLDILTQPDLSIDLAVEMPQACRQPKDYLNFRYHHKRALYCAYLANQLRGHDLVESVNYCWKDANHMRPVVVLKLAGKNVKHIQVKLHPCLPESNFKKSRLLPSKSNIRKQWYTGKSEIEETFPATPCYNSSILADMSMESHLHSLYNAAVDFPGFKDGILLLKVWLRQRQLDKGAHSFSGFVMSMLVAYLLSKRVLNKLMSGYQVFRNTVHYLAGSDWTTHGITLCSDTSDKHLPALKDFHQHFDVVFLDSSGYLNFCADMTKATFQQVRHEANLAKVYLDTPAIDGFDSLFMMPVPFGRKFDHIFHLDNLGQLKESSKRFKQLEDPLLDHGGDRVKTCLPRLLALLHRGLGSRVDMIAVRLQEDKQWKISDDPPQPEDMGPLTFGLLLNQEFAGSVLERGPEANTPEAEEFQKFWGEGSELRRFQDGSICEAVVWPGQTAAEKRLICSHIIKHLCKIHAGISPDTLTYVGDQLDPILHQPVKGTPQPTPDSKPQDPSQDPHPGTGEEENMTLVQAYNEVCKDLRGLKGFPLVMTSVQGISPVLRYTEVFPPTPVQARKLVGKARIHGYIQVPVSNQPCPDWVPAVKVICQLEGSGKWPDDLAAIQRIKAAFHIRLGQLLHNQCKLVTSATPKYVDVLKEGYVFRVEVAHRREIGLLKETVTPDGMKVLRDNPQSLELEIRTVMLPRLTSTLHGLQQQHVPFSGTARLAKRWLCAQLLSNHVPDEAIDLLVAYLFLQPAPLTVPGSPLVGFLRFLHLLSSHDWQSTAVIINLNNEMQDSDYDEIRQHFTEQRSQLPPMFLATPTDKLNSVWTQKQPTAQILRRLLVLAKESLRVLMSQMMVVDTNVDFKQVFRPPLDLYDVVIHLRPKLVPRRGEVVDRSSGAPGQTSSMEGNLTEKSSQLPVVDFDPVSLYLKELESCHGDLALFFHDRHGGSFIAVLWNPNAFQPQPFKVLQAKGMMPQPSASTSKEVVVTPNVEAIIEDFKILGQGLVQSVEIRTEKWVI